jgi:hypothetical protein
VIREQPWHEPRPTSEHYLWFNQLVELHSLTRQWLTDLEIETPPAPHQLKRIASPKVHEKFARLETMMDQAETFDLVRLVDETDPHEFLTRLENTVWVVQGWTLRSLLDRIEKKEEAALINLLQQSSFKCGREVAERRWRGVDTTLGTDFRACLSALFDSPFAGYPRHRSFLIKRSVPDDVQIELLHCPHRMKQVEVVQVADTLCSLHSHWIRGFVYALNSKIMVEEARDQGPLCCLRWHPADDAQDAGKLF